MGVEVPKKQTVYIQRNPKQWVYPYSVRAIVGDSRYIVSQHKTKKSAESAAKRVANKNVRKLLGFGK